MYWCELIMSLFRLKPPMRQTLKLNWNRAMKTARLLSMISTKMLLRNKRKPPSSTINVLCARNEWPLLHRSSATSWHTPKLRDSPATSARRNFRKHDTWRIICGSIQESCTLAISAIRISPIPEVFWATFAFIQVVEIPIHSFQSFEYLSLFGKVKNGTNVRFVASASPSPQREPNTWLRTATNIRSNVICATKRSAESRTYKDTLKSITERNGNCPRTKLVLSVRFASKTLLVTLSDTWNITKRWRLIRGFRRSIPVNIAVQATINSTIYKRTCGKSYGKTQLVLQSISLLSIYS